MWAAFCEIVCQASDLSHISAAFVWKRAAKLRSFFRHGKRRLFLSSTDRRIQDSIGCRGSTSPAFCPLHTESEDIVLSDEDTVPTEDIDKSLYGTVAPSYVPRGARSIRGGCIRASGQIPSCQQCSRQTPVDRIRRSLSHGTSDYIGSRGMSTGGARSFNASPLIAMSWPRRALVTEGLSPREAPSVRHTVQYYGDRKDEHVKPCKREEALNTGVCGSMDHGEAVISVRSCSQKQLSVHGNDKDGQHNVRVWMRNRQKFDC